MQSKAKRVLGRAKEVRSEPPALEHSVVVEVPDTCTCKPATLSVGDGTLRVLHQICCPALTSRET
jgi:hypothetical protein